MKKFDDNAFSSENLSSFNKQQQNEPCSLTTIFAQTFNLNSGKSFPCVSRKRRTQLSKASAGFESSEPEENREYEIHS